MPQLKTQHPALGLTNVLLCINKACRFESLSQQFLNLFPSQRTRQHTLTSHRQRLRTPSTAVPTADSLCA